MIKYLACVALLVAGSAGAQLYNPPDPQALTSVVVKSAVVQTNDNGEFSVTWSVPFTSPMPAAAAETVMNSGMPSQCQIVTSTATTVTGYCAQSGPTTLGATLASIAGVTVSPYPIRVAAGTRVTVIAREPTQ